MYLRGCEDGGRIAAAKARVWHDRAASVGGGGAFERREGLPSPRLLRKVETAAGSTDFFLRPSFSLPLRPSLPKCPESQSQSRRSNSSSQLDALKYSEI
jgi:hypothetical protein